MAQPLPAQYEALHVENAEQRRQLGCSANCPFPLRPVHCVPSRPAPPASPIRGPGARFGAGVRGPDRRQHRRRRPVWPLEISLRVATNARPGRHSMNRR